MSFAGPVALAAAQDPPRVVLHLDEPAFDAPATAAVADVWGLAARCMDLSDAGRTSVHVHNDAAACQQVAGRHRQPHGQDSPGFVVAKGDVAHVLYHRATWCRDARWRVGNLTMQLALRQASPLDPEEWPAWFEGGLAAFAEGPFRSEKGLVEPRHHVSRTLPSGYVVGRLGARRPSVERVLLEDLAGVQEREHPAVYRQLFVFLLTEHPEATRAALRAATAAASRAIARDAMIETLRAELGAETFAGLDAAWGEFLDALPETIDLQFHPEPDAVGQPGEPGFRPASPAVTWLGDNRKSKFTLSTQAFLAQIGQGDLVFERKGGRWVRVTVLAAGERGHVFVSERLVDDDGTAGWNVLAATTDDVPSIRVGGSVDLRVAAVRRRITVSVGGVDVLATELPSGTLAGRFGVGGPFGNQVKWRGGRLR